MIKKVLFIVLLISLLYNCAPSSSDGFTEISFNENDVNSIHVKSTEILNVCDSIVVPNTILCMSDKLIINEMGQKGIFHAINIKNEKYMGLFGNKGRGPGEMSAPWSIMKNGSGILQAFDPQQRKVVQFNIDSLINKNPFRNEYMLKELLGATDVFILKDTAYSLNHFKGKNRIYVSDLKGNVIEGLGTIPDFNTEIPENAFAEGHSAKIQFMDNIFALSYKTTPLIQIFNNESKQSVLIRGPEHFSSIFKENPHPNIAISYTEETRMGYIDIKVTDEYIFALYSGKNLFKNSDFNGNIIYKFKLDGTPMKKIVLDKGVVSFDVYQNKYIYGINMDSEGKNKLLRFNL